MRAQAGPGGAPLGCPLPGPSPVSLRPRARALATTGPAPRRAGTSHNAGPCCSWVGHPAWPSGSYPRPHGPAAGCSGGRPLPGPRLATWGRVPGKKGLWLLEEGGGLIRTERPGAWFVGHSSFQGSEQLLSQFAGKTRRWPASAVAHTAARAVASLIS